MRRTVIAIAHRLSTIAAMDRLVVDDQAGSPNRARHAELLERDGALRPAVGTPVRAGFWPPD